jgi:ABC-type dipeptide/oligopeptide/nickel transport system permease component
VQGLAMVFSVLVMVINLAADLAYMAIDRRVMRA